MKLGAIAVLALSIIFQGCTTTTKIVPAGKDTFIVAGSDGVSHGSMIKIQLYVEATAHCSSVGKELQPTNESVSADAAELRFRCLDANDPEYHRPVMEPEPNIKIESK